MGQRLSDSAVRPVRHHIDDPYWKTPLGYKKNGQPFFPVGGASPDDDGGEGGTGGSGGSGGGSGSEGQQGGEGGTGGEGAGGNKDDKTETVSKSDYEQLQERMKAADRNASEAMKKLKELEEKDLSEQEKVLKRVPELETQVAELSSENKVLKAKVAFFGIEGYSWHDPEVALGQVDLSEVTKEDGSIDKGILKKAVEKLAKDKPFLVKTSSDGGKDDKNGGGAGGAGGGKPSGSNVGGGAGGGTNTGLDEAALRRKYPSLNT